MTDAMLEKYARLVVKTGLNLQKGQLLTITSPIECAPFVRMVAQTAYQEGARDVVILWKDELFTKIRFLHAPSDIFDHYPDWVKDTYVSLARQGSAFLSIAAADPELMKDVDPDRMLREERARSTAIKEFMERLMSNRNVWCVVSIPTKAWAGKVFPGLSEDQAVGKLWEAIFTAVRVDMEDPVAAWKSHQKNLKRIMNFLNEEKLKSLHYRNRLGTDLLIHLPEDHIWMGGSDFTPEGLEFVANMPTEEVFTLPARNGVNGVVFSSMPFIYDGNRVENFSLTFKDGKVIDFQAESGYETLKRIVTTDEGAAYLGEVALVPFDSPINNAGIIFMNTLYDENASCHLALGKAYPVCLKNGENMEKEELLRHGVNDSLVHVDFMIGTADLEITGVTVKGEEIQIFKNGNYSF